MPTNTKEYIYYGAIFSITVIYISYKIMTCGAQPNINTQKVNTTIKQKEISVEAKIEQELEKIEMIARQGG